MTRASERRRDRPLAQVAEHSRNAIDIERTGLHTPSRGGSPKLRERRCGALARLLVGAGTDEHRDSVALQSARQVRQKPQRGLIGPLRVVDRHQHRRLSGQIGNHPIQAVQERLRSRLRHVPDVQEHRSRERRRAPQQPVAITLLANCRLQALAHHTHWVIALKLRRARVQYRHPALGRSLTRRPQQRGLSDPGGALYEHQPTRTRPRRSQN